MALFGVFNAAAFLDAKYIRKNDYFESGALMIALFGALDVISDVIFAVTVTLKQSTDGDEVPIMVPIVAWTCIVFPVLVSLVQLFRKMQSEWGLNDQIRRWMFKFSCKLYFVAILCGSAFGALALFNSNAFQLYALSMGLSKNQLGSFNVQRVWSIVFLENLPQLGLQIWFMVRFGPQTVAVASAAFSTISILVTILAAFTQNNIVQSQQSVLVGFVVDGLSDRNGNSKHKQLGSVEILQIF